MPPEAGRAFLPAAQQALVNLSAAGQDLREVIDPDRGRVALGFGHSRGPRDVPRLLDAFLAAYPDISFTLKQGGAPAVLDQLGAGTLDVVIVASIPPADDRLETLVLAEERLCLTVASDHRLANRAAVDLRQAATETFVGLTPQHALRRLFDSLCERAGLVPTTDLRGRRARNTARTCEGWPRRRRAAERAHITTQRSSKSHCVTPRRVGKWGRCGTRTAAWLQPRGASSRSSPPRAPRCSAVG